MGVRLIAGRAGSGKTYWCQSEICEALASSPTEGPRLVMLVPEQAALQMERGLLARLASSAPGTLRPTSGAPGARQDMPERTRRRPSTKSSFPALGRCEVLSFRRLAHRVLNEAAGPMPVTLSPTGRQMALRHLILRNRKALREFGTVAERGGFVAAIARGIAELLQESVTTEQMETAAREAEEAGDASGPRLHDAALLYRAYLDYLGSERVDPEGMLDLARARLGSAEWLNGAQVWIDGFAGLTRQQVRMIVAMSQRASHVDVALLLDPTRGRARNLDSEPDDLSLFVRTERTWFAIARALHDVDVPIEEPVFLGASGCPRFRGAAALGRIERDFFAVPAVRPSSTGSKLPVAPKELPAVRKLPVTRGEDRGTDVSPEAPPPGRRCHKNRRCHKEQAERENSRSRDNQQSRYGEAPFSIPVRLVRAPDRRAEVAGAIGTLVDLVQRSDAPMRYRDVAIVVRDLGQYHDLVSASLRAHDIPFFIDRRRPTRHHPLVQAVRGALAMHAEGPFGQAITMLLKSGLGGLDDEAADALENYVLAHGLVTPDIWEEPWSYPVVPRGDDRLQSSAARQALTAVNESRTGLRERVSAWWPAEAGKRGQPACRKWVERLYALLERLGVADHLAAWCAEAAARGDLDEVEEHRQVWSDLVKLLDEMAEALGDQQMTGRQFRDVLESGLSEFTLGLVPATVDQVLVSSVERSRHPPVRAVFVLGFEDGLFPARVAQDTILGDEERARLDACGVKLGRTQAQQLLDERMLAYIAVTRPSEFLWVSYPESDEAGRQLSPSPYWASLRAVLPEVTVETVEAGGPGAVSTGEQLAGGLAMNMRAWCEHVADHGDSSPSRELWHRRLACGFTAETAVPQDGPAPVPQDGQMLGQESHLGAGADRDSATWMALYAWARSTEPVSATVGAVMSALAPPPAAQLSAAATAALWSPPHRTSVTRLEQFAWCPFQHFAASGLRLVPRARHEVSSLDMGLLYHTILEQFVNELMETGTSLRDMSATEIARNLSRLSRTVVPAYAEQARMEDNEQRKAIWRSSVELPAALAGQQSAIGRTPLQSVTTEMRFGGDEAEALPALELRTAGGRTVQVRGKIDRVDVLQADDVSLAVVLDYKRSIGRRLQLDEVYHGLALQLLAYLLVIRDQGGGLTSTTLVPGGAFYVPLLGLYERVQHPDEAEEEAFNGYKSYKPRGVVDFDWIDRLDPSLESGWSSVFAVHRTTKGEMGYIDNSDAVRGGVLPVMLDHVRRKMGELADDWLSGNVAVSPARLGKDLRCSRCLYRSVCRYEYVTRQARTFARMSRTRVLDELTGQSGENKDG
ncbi:MAG: PD-(D/E)XK nuclease family protein [Phycisphaerae bacterium]|nr:PD-(D/E)XK nuclease family protein [Phycisphaerae bacterium]